MLLAPISHRDLAQGATVYVRKYRDKWRVEITKNGERLSKVFETKREAQAWGHEVESSLSTKATGWHTFEHAAQRYIKEVCPKKKGEVWEVRRIHSFIEHFPKKLGDIDAPDIAAWRDKRLKTVSSSTVVREANLLKHVFSTARDEWRLMENDPFRGIKLPAENEPRNATWSWKLIKRVLRRPATGKTREVQDAFRIALATAMRLQEVLFAPIAFDPVRSLCVMETKTGLRYIPISKRGAKYLDRPPFTVSPNEASTLFAKLTKSLMIDGLTFHDARGTALTMMAKKVDVMTLAKVSGHKDLSLLMNTYYRPKPEDIAKLL
jgi:integrase